MVIDENILHSAGAEVRDYKPAENIFCEGDTPNYYYQIIKGEVKLNNYNEEGKEFIQNILTEGQSCGEAILFIDKPYPMNAEALTECSILRLHKSIFLIYSAIPLKCAWKSAAFFLNAFITNSL